MNQLCEKFGVTNQQRTVEFEALNTRIKEGFMNAQAKAKHTMSNIIKNYPTKEELDFISPHDYQNAKTQIEQLQETHSDVRLKSLETKWTSRKSELQKTLKNLEQTFNDKLKHLKLDFTDFRGQILTVQRKTVAEAEKVVSQLSERAYEQDSQGRLQDSELRDHMKGLMKRDMGQKQLADKVNGLRKELARVENLMLLKTKTGEESFGRLREEVDGRIDKIGSGEVLKREVAREVERMMTIERGQDRDEQDEVLK